MAQNGFDGRIDALLVDEEFLSDGIYRRSALEELQQDMLEAPVDEELLASLRARLQSQFPDRWIRFRSSTNAEDLNGFSGAGLYRSASGAVGEPERPVDVALKTVWSSLWNFRAYEEREYVSINHTDVAMAVLVHPSFPDETANGVAITANLFDPAPGGEDAFYINAQAGAVSVVQPPESTLRADQLVYYYFHNNQPADVLHAFQSGSGRFDRLVSARAV